MHGRLRLRPWELRRLTLPELARALDEPDGKRKPPSGAKEMSATDVIEYAARYRAMTPRQRLELAKET